MEKLGLGKHAVTVGKVEIIEVGNKGTPCLSVGVKNDDGYEFAPFWLSENALENSVKNLSDIFGFNGDFSTVESQLIGKPCEVEINEKEYEGKFRNEVRIINPKRVAKPVENSALKKLTDRAKGILKNVPTEKPQKDGDPF